MAQDNTVAKLFKLAEDDATASAILRKYIVSAGSGERFTIEDLLLELVVALVQDKRTLSEKLADEIGE